MWGGEPARSDSACAHFARRYSCEWGGVAAGRPYAGGLEAFGQLVLQDVWNMIQKLYLQVSGNTCGQGSGEGVGWSGSPGWEVTWWGLCEFSGLGVLGAWKHCQLLSRVPSAWGPAGTASVHRR